MALEKNWLSSETEILRRIIGDRSILANTIHFLLDAAFPHPEHAFGQDVLVGINVPREHLNLAPCLKPGDIDLLIVPIKGSEIFPEKAMAVEAKILRPTIKNPGRNANKMGATQARGLLRDGFPFVGLVHISVPERLPPEMLWPIKRLNERIFDDGSVKEIGDSVLIDPFPIFSAQRQLGRIDNIGLPQAVGYNAIGLSLSYDGQAFIGNTLGDGRQALKNSSSSDDLVQSIREFIKLQPEYFSL